MTTKYYKFLNGLQACHGGSYTYEIGEWTPEIDDVEACQRGYHICKADQMIEWMAQDLYECEAEGVIELENKCVAKRIRLLGKVETWDDKTARLFAVWCARQVQHLMTDERSVKSLDVAERYANGKATDEELAAAAEAAVAARAAAWAVTGATRAAVGAAWAAKAAAEAARAAVGAAWVAARTKQSAKLKEMLGVEK